MPSAGDEFPIEDPVVERLLSGANLARLAYVGLDRRPRVVPIWFAYEDGDFLMVTQSASGEGPDYTLCRSSHCGRKERNRDV
jgi:hypothetical protein